MSQINELTVPKIAAINSVLNGLNLSCIYLQHKINCQPQQ